MVEEREFPIFQYNKHWSREDVTMDLHTPSIYVINRKTPAFIHRQKLERLMAEVLIGYSEVKNLCLSVCLSVPRLDVRVFDLGAN